MSDEEGGIFRIDPDEVRWTTDRLKETKQNRDEQSGESALNALSDAAELGTNLMDASILE